MESSTAPGRDVRWCKALRMAGRAFAQPKGIACICGIGELTLQRRRLRDNSADQGNKG